MNSIANEAIAWVLVALSCCGLTRFMDKFVWLIFYTRGDNVRFDSDWNRRMEYTTQSANSFCFALAAGFVAAIWFRFMT